MLFIPQSNNLPPIEIKNNWYIIRSPLSLLLQPGERKLVSCGYELQNEINPWIYEASLSLLTKGVLVIGSNLNEIRQPGEELIFIIQNINPIEITTKDNPLIIFGDKNRVQISAGNELVKIKIINFNT